MKKVMQFIKRRICPIMLALVIVFFSVVIPCAKVEAASIAAPVAGYTYFDLVYSLLYSTGFAASMQESDASKSFDKAMYDGFCDYFSMWCYDNLGTADGEEIGEMLRALPDQIVDGTVSVSKTLWEAVQSWASDVYDSISSIVKPEDYINDSGLYTWGLVSSYGVPLPKSYTSSSSLFYTNCNYMIGRYYLPSRYAYYYFIYWSTNADSVEFKVNSDGQYSLNRAFDSTGSISNCDSSSLCWIDSNSFCSSYSIYSTDIKIFANTFDLSFTGSSDSASVTLPTDTAPDVLWPQQDLAIDKVGSTTWDDAIASDVVVPGEVADTGSIAIDDSIPADSDVIPGTVDVPEEKDDTKEEEKEKEEEEDPADETVTDEEIGTLPDTAAAAGDITKLFPFCIPFDLVALIKGMKAQEKAPVWHFKYYFKDINYTFEFTVDMTDYEKYIKIFRAGIVIFWIITLMFVTIRYTSAIKD